MAKVRSHDAQLVAEDIDPPRYGSHVLTDAQFEHVLEPLGEVFTREWVVEWMLDLVGYTPDKELHRQRILDPSCGSGAFIIAALERIIKASEKGNIPLDEYRDSLIAIDLHTPAVAITRSKIVNRLCEAGCDSTFATDMATAWVQQRDFLASDPFSGIDYVIGNPPYVRLEDMPSDRLQFYRDSLRTMRGRADLYVGFYEKGLEALSSEGVLCFICADRWMRNSYGRALRELITENVYSVDVVVRMHGVDCFESDVSAYPAITVIGRRSQGAARVVEATEDFGPEDIDSVNAALEAGADGEHFGIAIIDGWFGSDIWPEGTPVELQQLEQYESRHEPLQDVEKKTRVGIGVATGADRIFVTDKPDLVERDRMLPLVMPRHIANGYLEWRPERYLVNPWTEDGLVDLGAYPELARYLTQFKSELCKRHTAKNQPERWHKTIDRVHPRLTGKAKILLTDMKARMTPVLEPGGLYPHHNIYWITSDRWDLEALCGLLLSKQAELFVRAYCVKMRSGTLRMQAQYLRKIRLPSAERLTQEELNGLKEAYRALDREEATRIAGRLYDA